MMGESEGVVVDRSESGKWWRLTYKGVLDFLEDEPTEAQRVEFRKRVDDNIRRAAAEQRAAARHGGGGRAPTVQDVPT